MTNILRPVGAAQASGSIRPLWPPSDTWLCRSGPCMFDSWESVNGKCDRPAGLADA